VRIHAVLSFTRGTLIPNPVRGQTHITYPDPIRKTHYRVSGDGVADGVITGTAATGAAATSAAADAAGAVDPKKRDHVIGGFVYQHGER
jgi:hypothetical protein